MVDTDLEASGEPALTFFEALTVLAFACFADAPADVVVLEVGMGGEWDSTNVADGQVAVFTPIALDHQNRSTVASAVCSIRTPEAPSTFLRRRSRPAQKETQWTASSAS